MSIPFEAQLRKMDSREASDLGLLVWRENFIYFLPFFAVPFWLCAFALRMLSGSAQYFSWLILWLLKPLFDRIILHIISLRFFENGAGMKRLFKGLGKTLRRGLLGDLLWRRFSSLRAVMMPVRVLETDVPGKLRFPQKKSGRETAKRKELLKKGGIGYCSFLTVWGIALEITLLTGEILFFTIMAELIAKDSVSFSADLIKNSEIYIFAAWCFNYMFIETLYVCMGFSLYINSRIEVEGWDIEIMFRSFAKKLKKKKAAGALIVFFLFCMFLPAKPLAAEEVPLETLQNILNSPDFGGEQDSWGIRLKNPPKESDIPDFNISPILEKLRIIFAFMLRIILIAVLTAFFVFLFLYVRKLIHNKNSEEKVSALTFLSGIPSGNPELLLKKAEAAFEKGSLRMAWGYCTAAAILSWPLYRGIAFPPNATESDCAGIVNSTPSCNHDEVQTFERLINNWINFAYAGRLPQKDSFTEAAAFCKSMSLSAPGNKDG